MATTQPSLTNAEQIRDHRWWRPGWRRGRRFYAWHLTFEGQQDLHALVDRYQCALSGLAGLDMVPREWLHLTMQGVGFVDEVTTADVERIARAARRRLAALPVPGLAFGRTVVFPESVVLAPEPAQPVHEIRSAVRAAIAEVWGTAGVPEREEGFRAHVSVAYSNSARPAAPVVAALGAVDAAAAVVTVTAASLIVLHRDAGMYRRSSTRTRASSTSNTTAARPPPESWSASCNASWP